MADPPPQSLEDEALTSPEVTTYRPPVDLPPPGEVLETLADTPSVSQGELEGLLAAEQASDDEAALFAGIAARVDAPSTTTTTTEAPTTTTTTTEKAPAVKEEEDDAADEVGDVARELDEMDEEKVEEVDEE